MNLHHLSEWQFLSAHSIGSLVEVTLILFLGLTFQQISTEGARIWLLLSPYIDNPLVPVAIITHLHSHQSSNRSPCFHPSPLATCNQQGPH
jgi:hypothetical protein